jgi:hypothetical protein
LSRRKWDIFKWGENGRLKEESIANVAEVLIKILHSDLRRVLNLEIDKAPTREQSPCKVNYADSLQHFGVIMVIIQRDCMIILY